MQDSGYKIEDTKHGTIPTFLLIETGQRDIHTHYVAGIVHHASCIFLSI